jgi:hypothetical protein
MIQEYAYRDPERGNMVNWVRSLSYLLMQSHAFYTWRIELVYSHRLTLGLDKAKNKEIFGDVRSGEWSYRTLLKDS